jgi:hypothetical protein
VQSTQSYFTSPCGQGSQSAQASFRLHCKRRSFDPIAHQRFPLAETPARTSHSMPTGATRCDRDAAIDTHADFSVSGNESRVEKFGSRADGCDAARGRRWETPPPPRTPRTGVSRTARRAREVSVETAARAVPRIARAWRADGVERAFTAAVGATGAPPRVDWGTAEAPPLLVAFSVGFGSGA